MRTTQEQIAQYIGTKYGSDDIAKGNLAKPHTEPIQAQEHHSVKGKSYGM